VKWGLASPFDVKATDKGEQGVHGWHVDARRVGGERWSCNWHGRDAALVVDFGARSERRLGMHAQGGNGRWAGCPGGLGPDYSGLGQYCRTGLGPRSN
jgi:hypothetical protein